MWLVPGCLFFVCGLLPSFAFLLFLVGWCLSRNLPHLLRAESSLCRAKTGNGIHSVLLVVWRIRFCWKEAFWERIVRRMFWIVLGWRREGRYLGLCLLSGCLMPFQLLTGVSGNSTDSRNLLFYVSRLALKLESFFLCLIGLQKLSFVCEF